MNTVCGKGSKEWRHVCPLLTQTPLSHQIPLTKCKFQDKTNKCQKATAQSSRPRPPEHRVPCDCAGLTPVRPALCPLSHSLLGGHLSMEELSTELLRPPISPARVARDLVSSSSHRLPHTSLLLRSVNTSLRPLDPCSSSILFHVDFVVPRFCNSEYVSRDFQIGLFQRYLPHSQEQMSKENVLN